MDTAAKYLEASLALFEQVHEAPHEHIAVGLQTMGVMYISSFESEKAVDYLQRAVRMFEQLEAEKGIAFRKPRVYQALGQALLGAGRTTEADSLFNIALPLFRKMYGNRHPVLGNILRSKSQVHVELNQPDSAKPYLEECLELYQALYGPNSGRVATVWGSWVPWPQIKETFNWLRPIIERQLICGHQKIAPKQGHRAEQPRALSGTAKTLC